MSADVKRRWMSLVFLSLAISCGSQRFFVGSDLKRGTEWGNGGYLVECDRADGQKSLELLDYFEFNAHIDMRLNLAGNAEDYLGLARDTIGRLKRLDPARHERYAALLQSFKNPEHFIEDKFYVASPCDVGETFLKIPENCRLRVGAVQRYSTKFKAQQFFVSRALWDRLDETHKAGLVLHEIIYRDALERGHLNSKPTRFFNRLLSSQAITKLTKEEYDAVLTKYLLRGYWGFESKNPRVNPERDTKLVFFPEVLLGRWDAEEFCATLSSEHEEFHFIQNDHLLYKIMSDYTFLPKSKYHPRAIAKQIAKKVEESGAFAMHSFDREDKVYTVFRAGPRGYSSVKLSDKESKSEEEWTKKRGFLCATPWDEDTDTTF